MKLFQRNKRDTENNDRPFLDNDCVRFFYGLNPKEENTKGICGYLAVEYFLYYYDERIIHGLIDEKYKEKDGTLSFKDYLNDKKLSNLEYISEMERESDNVLIGLLLSSIGKKYGLYNETNGKNPGKTFEGDASRIGDYYSEHHFILDKYLYEIKGMSEDDIKTTRIKEDHRNTLIALLKEGIPVLLSANRHGRNGHVFIAYDYDSSTDEIYGNFLIKNGGGHEKVSDYFTHFGSMIYIFHSE